MSAQTATDADSAPVSLRGPVARSPALVRSGIEAVLIAGWIFLLAFFVQALFVKSYGVNVPYWDEWEHVELFAKYLGGTLRLDDLLAFHNEHRIVTVRLASLALLAGLGEWSPIAGMLLSALLLGAALALWAYRLARLGLATWTIAVSSLVLLSPLQWENILWGFQIQFYTLVLGSFLGICVVAGAVRLNWRVLLGAMGGCSLATFSMAAGLLSWAVVGGCLLVRALLVFTSRDERSREPLPWAKALVFGACGAWHAAFYLNGMPYIPEHQAMHAHDIGVFLRWIVVALAYPLLDRTTGTSAPVAVLFAIVVWAPIMVFAMVCFRDREEPGARGRLVLVAGGILFVTLSAASIAYGRGNVPYVFSRYATALLWTSSLSLLALGGLLQTAARLASPTRPRLVALLALLVGVQLLVHAHRFGEGQEAMRGEQTRRQGFFKNIRAFVEGTSPGGRLAGPLPYPSLEFLEKQLRDESRRAFMPSELVQGDDGVGWMREGDAWTPGGVYPATPPPNPSLAGAGEWWGSWSGSDAHLGRLRSSPIHVARSVLVVPLAGYPVGGGNELAIRKVDSKHGRLAYRGANPGEAWADWRVDVTDWIGADVQIVAIDGNTGNQGWLGVGPPLQVSRRALWLHRFLESLETLAGTMAAIWLSVHLWVTYGPRGALTGRERDPAARGQGR